MTLQPGQDDWLRAASARSHELHTPSPAPLDEILTAGRARRRRRRGTTATAAAACVLALGLGLGLPLSRPHNSPPSTGRSTPAAPPRQGHAPISAAGLHGVVDGRRWSVVWEFYPTLPKGFGLPSRDGATSPAGKSSLVCQRMVIGGVRIDHQGGPWADCTTVQGTHDPSRAGEAGLWGLHEKGTSGTRLFVANPEADVAYGVVNLKNHTPLKATTITIPGTSYRAWAVAIPNGQTITSVDTYNTHHQRLSHDTYWR